MLADPACPKCPELMRGLQDYSVDRQYVGEINMLLAKALFEYEPSKFRTDLSDYPARLIAKIVEEADKPLAEYLIERGMDPMRLRAEGGFLQCSEMTPADWNAWLKEHPYHSGDRGEIKNFNCRAKFADGQHSIVCLDLTMKYLGDLTRAKQEGRALKFDYQQFSGLDAITNALPKSRDEHQIALYQHQSVESYLVENRRFGEFLVDQFHAMQASGTSERLMYLGSTNHAMALVLQRKTDSEGKQWHVVKLFDPNETTTHMRCKAADIKVFERHSLQLYLGADKTREQCYYRETDVQVSYISVLDSGGANAKALQQQAAEICAPPVGTFAPDPSEAARAITRSYIPSHLDGTIIWHFFHGNFAGDLLALEEPLKRLPVKHAIDLLKTIRGSGTPALAVALCSNNVAAVQACARLLKAIEAASPEAYRQAFSQIVSLIKAQHARSKQSAFQYPPFFLHGPAAIRAYAALIECLPCAEQDAQAVSDAYVELIAPVVEDENFKNVVHALIACGNVASLQEYIKLLRRLPLDLQEAIINKMLDHLKVASQHEVVVSMRQSVVTDMQDILGDYKKGIRSEIEENLISNACTAIGTGNNVSLQKHIHQLRQLPLDRQVAIIDEMYRYLALVQDSHLAVVPIDAQRILSEYKERVHQELISESRFEISSRT